jgi:shikimate dehydrogenase
MRVFGLIGYPLSHSFSPDYFAQKFSNEGIEDASYRLFPIENIDKINELLLSDNNICGLNVTIPYKQQVIPYLNEIDDTARVIGAVNTICVSRSSSGFKLSGYNTDVIGVLDSLKGQKHHKKALVLGSGGASKAVIYALNQLQILYTIVSRNPKGDNQISYNQLSEKIIQESTLIINTTPLGMSPNINDCPPIPYHAIGQNHFIFDLIYNPKETLFMKTAHNNGAQTINGLKMLYSQAEASWQLWNKTENTYL